MSDQFPQPPKTDNTAFNDWMWRFWKWTGGGGAVSDATIITSDITTNNATTAKHGFAPKATAPAAGLLNALGIGNAETSWSAKPLFDTTNPAALGTAAPGSQLVAARRDHVHALPALDAVAAPSDITTLDATTSAHGLLPKATAPAVGLLNALGIANGETSWSAKGLFDTTNPAALGTAGPGSQVVAARRDHVHAMPALDTLSAPTDITTLNATTSAHGLLPKLGGGTTNFLRADGTWSAPGASGITGSGTTGYVPKFSSSTAVADSHVRVDTGNSYTSMGYTATAPFTHLSVSGYHPATTAYYTLHVDAGLLHTVGTVRMMAYQYNYSPGQIPFRFDASLYDFYVNSAGTSGGQLRVSSAGVVIGPAALSTSATSGFLYIPTCAGTPSGTPTSTTGTAAIVYDSSNNKLYVYNGGWKSVTLA